MKKFWLLMLAFALLLTGCATKAAQTQTIATEPPIEELTMVVTEDTIGELGHYGQLKRVDLSGSTCYDAIMEYAWQHPNVEVIYTVTLGKTQVSPDVESLTLEEGSYTFSTLRDGLPYLKNLKELSFPKTSLTQQQMDTLRQEKEGLEIEFTLEFYGQELGMETKSLDLSALTPEEMEASLPVLSQFPNIETIQLLDEEGNSQLDVAQVHALQQAVPNALLQYSFTLFGKTVSTTDERVEFRNMKLGDSREEELRQALDIMKGCQYMLLESCRFSDQVLSQLREDYRGQTKIVWRIYFARAGSCLTDRTVLRYVYNVTNSTVKQLKYCEDVEYVDFGHNEILSDWSWIAYMPKLKGIICSGSIIQDLTPFENCKELEFLELSNCGMLKDISPLAACESLKWLNISYTKAEDLSCLDDLPLETFVYVKPKASQEELDRFSQVHPQCLVQYKGNEYGYPWRYTEDGEPMPQYAHLQKVFGYPKPNDTTW